MEFWLVGKNGGPDTLIPAAASSLLGLISVLAMGFAFFCFSFVIATRHTKAHILSWRVNLGRLDRDPTTTMEFNGFFYVAYLS